MRVEGGGGVEKIAKVVERKNTMLLLCCSSVVWSISHLIAICSLPAFMNIFLLKFQNFYYCSQWVGWNLEFTAQALWLEYLSFSMLGGVCSDLGLFHSM